MSLITSILTVLLLPGLIDKISSKPKPNPGWFLVETEGEEDPMDEDEPNQTKPNIEAAGNGQAVQGRRNLGRGGWLLLLWVGGGWDVLLGVEALAGRKGDSGGL